MKLNIASPPHGTQKIVEIEDNNKILPFFERRIGHEVPGDSLGGEFTGYVFRITGGNDKQGFPMMQGVLLNRRARILLREGMKCFRPRRPGHRKRKSVRGCIVGPDLSVLSLSIVKKGIQDIPGLTDITRPRRLGPKRANRIRKLFGLSKSDDVKKFVIRRAVKGRKKGKAPKIQRLLTPRKIARQARSKHLDNIKKVNSYTAKKQYQALVVKWKVNQTKLKLEHPVTASKPALH